MYISIHPLIHVLRVQCSFTSSLGEFPGYCDWLWYPGLSPVLVSYPSPCIYQCFSIQFSSPVFEFHSCSTLRLMCLHPSVDPSLIQIFGEFSGLTFRLPKRGVVPTSLIS